MLPELKQRVGFGSDVGRADPQHRHGGWDAYPWTREHASVGHLEAPSPNLLPNDKGG